MRFLTFAASMAVVVSASCWAIAGKGIDHIAATEDSLLVYLEGSAATAALLEMASYEREPEGLMPVWHGTAGEGPIAIPRFDGERDRLYSKFQLLIPESGECLGRPRYVIDLTGLHRRDFAFPWPESIKGLTCPVMPEDIVHLGVKYLNLNVDLRSIFDWDHAGPTETWTVDGEDLPINTVYFEGLDRRIRLYTDAGINITVTLNNRVPTKPDPANPFIHPQTDLAEAPFHLGAINVTDARGLRYYRAALEYMAERYSRPNKEHGWITGYIVGNEVNAHWEWYNIGKTPLPDFVEQYGIAMRIASLAVRRTHPGIRVYISLEHHWNAAIRDDGLTAFRAKDFFDQFNAWSKDGGDFPWHVAFHPYPENLFDPRFWEDRQAALSFETPKVTFKNIEVLPAFLRQERFLYQGAPRHIILSEQGFHADDSPAGERLQAAAYAYAYHKLKHIGEIDAFMLHRHVSARSEAGLRLGLWTWNPDSASARRRRVDPGRKMFIHEVFRLADTEQWKEAFAFAKPLIGIESWDEALPCWDIEATPGLTPAFTLIDDGQPRYEIVVPDKRTAAIDYAALELRRYFREISGAAMPIVEAAAASGAPAIRLALERGQHVLTEDGIAIETAPNGDLCLYGQNERGVIYSAYALLERYLGVRFLTGDCTVIPRRKTVTLPGIRYRHSPPFMYRETLYFDSFPKRIAVQQRLNGPMSQCDAEVGGKWAFHPYVHSFAKLVPPETYFDEHPEYFSLVGGKRTNATVHGQLCLTNPEVLEIATAQVLKWIEEHPDVPIFDVSQNDGNGWCECAQCTAVADEEGSQHGPILRFVNAIADAVSAKYPDTWIETLAYAYSTKPPALTRPRDNVIIRLCHAGCYFHGFEACGLGANFAAHLEEWSKCTRRIFIWHYATNFAHYLAPNQNLEGLAKDIKCYAAHGVDGVMIQGNYQGSGGELAELRQYLAAQLMWEPERNPEMVRIEFCNGYYGPAASDVLDFLALMDAEGRRPELHAFGAWDPQNTVRPGFVARGLEILNRARGRAQNPETANRVAKLMLPLWYMQLAYPDRYGLEPATAEQTLLDIKVTVEANQISQASEGKPMQAWLAEMTARSADAEQPQTVIE